MKRLRCGEDVREVEVRAEGRALVVHVDGTAYRPLIEAGSSGTFVVRDGRRPRAFHCVQQDDVIHLWWEGVAYRLRDEPQGRRAAQRHLHTSLEAPMPGRVIAVKVQAGQAVARGDELVVVESMKMENALRAPRDGTVASVTAAVGEMVGPGRVLVELE